LTKDETIRECRQRTIAYRHEKDSVHDIRADDTP
jgi:hypothetical protein